MSPQTVYVVVVQFDDPVWAVCSTLDAAFAAVFRLMQVDPSSEEPTIEEWTVDGEMLRSWDQPISDPTMVNPPKSMKMSRSAKARAVFRDAPRFTGAECARDDYDMMGTVKRHLWPRRGW